MADLAFRAASSGSDTSFASASISCTLPTGTVQDDKGTIFISSSTLAPAAAPTHTTPSGWSLAGTTVFNGFNGGLLNTRYSLFYRLEPSVPAAVTVTASANAAHGYIRKSDNNPLVAGFFGQVNWKTGTSTGPNVNAMTTTKTQALIEMWISQSVQQVVTPDGSLTERHDDTAPAFEVADATQASAGATGTKTASVSASTDWLTAFAEWWGEDSTFPPLRPPSCVVLQAVNRASYF